MRESAGRKRKPAEFAAVSPGQPPVMALANAAPKKPPHRFQKGMPSANPGGKPKELREIQHLIREWSPRITMQLIHLALKAKSQAVQAQCGAILMDRAYGKPLQTVQAQVSIIDQLPLEQQAKLAQALEALAAGKLIEGVATEVKDDAK